MNTLGKEITGTFFKDGQEGYQKLVAHWSAMMNDKEARKEVTAEAHMLYLALTGKDWRKGFVEATNANKVANGHNLYGGKVNQIVGRVKSNWHNAHFFKIFGDTINEEGLKKVRAYINNSQKPLENDAYVSEVK